MARNTFPAVRKQWLVFSSNERTSTRHCFRRSSALACLVSLSKRQDCQRGTGRQNRADYGRRTSSARFHHWQKPTRFLQHILYQLLARASIIQFATGAVQRGERRGTVLGDRARAAASRVRRAGGRVLGDVAGVAAAVLAGARRQSESGAPPHDRPAPA